MSPRREEVTCSECGTANPVRSKFCESCGGSLVEQDAEQNEIEAPRPVAKRKRPARVHEYERRDINRAVARARTRLKGIRKLLIVLTVVNSVGTLLFWAAATEEPELYILVAGSGAMTALLLAASIFLYDQPLFWVVTVASIFTVATILAPGILAIIICVSLWGALPVILNVTRLQREHPDLITAQNLQHRTSARVSEAAAERIEARRMARRSQARRSYAVVAGVVLIGIVAIVATEVSSSSVSASTYLDSEPEALSADQLAARETAFREILVRFQAGWARSEHDTIEAIGSREFLSQRWYKVKDILERRGWSKHFPPIEFESVVSRSEDGREVWYAVTPRGQLKTRWVYEDMAWRVRRIVFSRTR